MLYARSLIAIQKKKLPAECRKKTGAITEEFFDKIAVKVAYEVITAIFELVASYENLHEKDPKLLEGTLKEGAWVCQRKAVIMMRVIYHMHCIVLSKNLSGDLFPSGIINALDMGLGKTVAASLMMYVSHRSNDDDDDDTDNDSNPIMKAVRDVKRDLPSPPSNNTSIVFSPPSLLGQWKRTLIDIFGKDAVAVMNNPDASTIQNLDVLVDGMCKVILLSTGMLQNSRKTGLLEYNTWLNFVVDEAHIGVGSRLTSNTKTNASSIDAVSRIAVTATPDQGDVRYMVALLEFCGLTLSKKASVSEVQELSRHHMIRISRDLAKEDIGTFAPPDPEYVTIVVNDDEDDPSHEAFSRMVEIVNRFEQQKSTSTISKISLSRQAVVFPQIIYAELKKKKTPSKRKSKTTDASSSSRASKKAKLDEEAGAADNEGDDAEEGAEGADEDAEGADEGAEGAAGAEGAELAIGNRSTRLIPTLRKFARELPAIEELPQISPIILKMVEDMASRPKHEKHVVMCHFTEETHAVVRALKDAKFRTLVFSGETSFEDKNMWIDMFKRFTYTPGGKLPPVLVCNIQCGSVGLNLQCANNIYFPTSDWNHQRELQAIGRLHRSGQKNVIRVVFLRHYLDTTEENIQAIQYNKIQHCNNMIGKSSDVTRHEEHRLKEGKALSIRKAAETIQLREEAQAAALQASASAVSTAETKNASASTVRKVARKVALARKESDQEEDEDRIVVPKNKPTTRGGGGGRSRSLKVKRSVAECLAMFA
jgi:superfamily II DNA or RNA helicase